LSLGDLGVIFCCFGYGIDN
jgi:hypothetical protein